ALRHGRHERDEPLPPCARGDAPRSPHPGRRSCAHGTLQRDARTPPSLHRRTPRRYARGAGLDVVDVLNLPRGRALSLNAGSSSLKAARFEAGELVARHDVALRDGGDLALARATAESLDALVGDGVDVVGHRVVHGGPTLHTPVVVDDAVLAQLWAAIPLAPL